MKSWTKRAEARPEELARAALELCAERGIHATRVADVAHRAGVTVGTVYRYFKDKDHLIQAALGSARPAAKPASAPDRPGAAIPALSEALRRWGTFFRDSGTRSVRVALSDPGLAAERTAPALGAISEAIDEITTLVEKAAARNEMRADIAPRSVARALVGALLLAPALGAAAADAQSDLDAVSAIATRGMRADGPSWRPAGG